MSGATALGPDVALVTASALGGGAPLVVLAPHPDDESLGCGGLLAAAFAGDGAHVVCLTDGARSHPGSVRWPPERLARVRAAELSDAVAHLGGAPADITWLGHSDGALPRTGTAAEGIVGAIAALCERLGARALFATSPLDAHADHQACAVLARAVRERRPALRLFDYPVWSREDTPEALFTQSGWRYHRLPVGPHLDAKRRAVAAHRSQHGLVVEDDPSGFVLPPSMVERFVRDDEIYIETPR